MNPRTQELVEKAVNKVAARRQLSDGQLERSWHPDHFNQAFAELVVQECAQVLWNIDSGELHDEYVESLKKHFGIE